MSRETPPTWPATLALVRHGESLGNLEARRASEAGLDHLDLRYRDADTPLSDAGRRQAEAVGAWWARQPRDERPEVVVSSPYRRAADTAALAVASSGLELDVRLDERLRERDLGLFDGLTASGIRRLHADEAERRSRLGKLYYRPPNGESWCDVALRVRSLVQSFREEHPGRRLVAVTHQAVIMCHRLVLEGLDERTLLAADRGDPLANCSSTRYDLGPDGSLVLTRYNDTAALDASEEAPVTDEPDRERSAP